MKRANLIGCAVLLIFLLSPVTTWAASCPEGQKMNDRKGECVKDRTSSSKKSTMTNYPYGGTCEQISKAYVERIAGKVH